METTIKNILEEKYPDDLWDITDIPECMVLRDYFDEGVRCLVLRSSFHLCAYLGIPIDHPLANKSYDDIPLQCHGGLTFGDKGDGKIWPENWFWYGWDYGHCDDQSFYKGIAKEFEGRGKKWTIKEVVSEINWALYDFKKLMKLVEVK